MKKNDFLENIAVYGFMIVVLGGLLLTVVWFIGAGVLLILEIFKNTLEPMGLPDLSTVDEVVGPLVVGLPIVGLIAAVMTWYDRRASSTTDIDDQKGVTAELTKFKLNAVVAALEKDRKTAADQAPTNTPPLRQSAEIALGIEESVTVTFVHLYENREYEFTKNATYNTFNRSVWPVDNPAKTECVSVSCPYCHERFEVLIYQQDVLNFAAEDTRDNDDLRARLISALRKPWYVKLAYALFPAWPALLMLVPLFFGVEIIPEGTSGWYAWIYIGAYSLVCLPIIILDDSLPFGKLRKLKRSELDLTVSTSKAKKLGLADLANDFRATIVRSVQLVDFYGNHSIAIGGDFEHTESNLSGDTYTTTTVTGQDVWHRRFDRPYNQQENEYEIGVKTAP